MELYTGVIYPLVLVVCAVLAALGLATLATPRTHRLLKLAIPVAYAATGIHAAAVVVLMLTGLDQDLFLSIGYTVASIAVLALLGIGRLGTPEAAAADTDPDRPVLTPAQIVRVDAVAAVIVAVALATVFWRVLTIVEGAA
ncbi:hypothetical protein [Demequina soli]|uniref:hypothetical protein n=1 Tax=Demequina soli TaxID=1638987 RepID=UPI0007824CCC|nr:hypothetical protein [Demequina soli]